MKNAIWIREPDIHHNNWGLEIYHNDPNALNRFRMLAVERFFANYEQRDFYGPFWQGQSSDWIYIEFWKSGDRAVRDRILEESAAIAQALGMTLMTQEEMRKTRGVP